MKKLHKAAIGILGSIAFLSSTAPGARAASQGYSGNPPTQQKNYEDALALTTTQNMGTRPDTILTAAPTERLILRATPTPSAKPSATPSAKPSPTPSAKPSAKPTATPTPKLSPKLTPTPDASPSAKVSPKATPTPEPKPTAKVSPKATSITATVVETITQTYQNIFESFRGFFHF